MEYASPYQQGGVEGGAMSTQIPSSSCILEKETTTTRRERDRSGIQMIANGEEHHLGERTPTEPLTNRQVLSTRREREGQREKGADVLDKGGEEQGKEPREFDRVMRNKKNNSRWDDHLSRSGKCDKKKKPIRDTRLSVSVKISAKWREKGLTPWSNAEDGKSKEAAGEIARGHSAPKRFKERGKTGRAMIRAGRLLTWPLRLNSEGIR